MKFVLFFLILVHAVPCFAQLNDYPNLNEGVQYESDAEIQSAQLSGNTIYIPIKFHVIVDQYSWFNDTSYVDTLLAVVNERFLPADIEFYKCEDINVIEDAEFANGKDPATIVNNLHPIHSSSNVINFYVPNSTITFGGYSFSAPFGATGYTVQYNSIVISGDQYLSGDNMLPSHELGHYFGLYHLASNPGNPELVDGSNCETAGDYCCDTPAEYSVMCCATLPECVYTPLFGEVTDTNGDTLVADVTNIMSNMQFNMNCRDVFTNDQVDRIRYYQENYLSDLFCGETTNVALEKLSSSKVYPNPASSFIKIQLQKGVPQYELLIYDLAGRVHMSTRFVTDQTEIVDIQNLKCGSYIVVLTHRGHIERHLLVVD